MKNEITKLEPHMNKRLTPELIESLEKTASLTGRRLGGGDAYAWETSLQKLAEKLIDNESGFYSKGGKKWNSKLEALQILLRDNGWYIEENEVLKAFALVRKPMIGSDGFICLDQGSRDISAAKKFDIIINDEIHVYGIPDSVNEFTKAISNQIGIAFEQGNDGDSLEVIVPHGLSGNIFDIIDVQKMPDNITPLNRKTEMIIVSKYAPTLSVTGMDINTLCIATKLSAKAEAMLKIVKSL